MKKYTLPIIKVISLIFLFPSVGFSQDQYNVSSTIENQPYAYCTTCSGAIWMNTSNLSDIDSQFCSATLKPNLTCFQDQCYWSRYLDCHNFGFSIPSNAIIKGIQLIMTRNCNMDYAVQEYEIFLRKDNMPAGSNMANSDFWTIENKTKSYGGNNELWGLTWTALEINSPQFGSFIKVKNFSTNSPIVNIDDVIITITYELTTGIYEQSSSFSPLTAYQDPVSGELNVNFEMQKESTITKLFLYDIQGKKCFSGQLKSNQGTLANEKINMDQFKNGIYVVNVYSDNKLFSTKFNLIK